MEGNGGKERILQFGKVDSPAVLGGTVLLGVSRDALANIRKEKGRQKRMEVIALSTSISLWNEKKLKTCFSAEGGCHYRLRPGGMTCLSRSGGGTKINKCVGSLGRKRARFPAEGNL